MTLFVFVIRPVVRRLLSWRTTWTPESRVAMGWLLGPWLALAALVGIASVSLEAARWLFLAGMVGLVIYGVRFWVHGIRDWTNDNKQRAEWLREMRAQRDADMGLTEAEARARGYYGPHPAPEDALAQLILADHRPRRAH